jgi:hypothetical protein
VIEGRVQHDRGRLEIAKVEYLADRACHRCGIAAALVADSPSYLGSDRPEISRPYAILRSRSDERRRPARTSVLPP